MDNIRLSVLTIVFLFLGASCSLKPTKVTVKQDPLTHPSGELPVFNGLKLSLNKATIILDTRSFFDFSSAHLFGAQRVDAQAFKFSKQGTVPEIEKMANEWSRTFARWGISKTSQVLIVGNGMSANLDEARLAFILYANGVDNVGFKPIQTIKWPLSTVESVARPSVAYWDANLKGSLFVLDKELKDWRALSTQFGNLESVVDKQKLVIDVRTETSYLKEPGILPTKVQTLNIPMKQFFDSQAQVSDAIRKRLEQLGYSVKTRIVVVGDSWSQTAAAVLALHSLGFVKAGASTLEVR